MNEDQIKQLRQLLLNIESMERVATKYEAYYYAIMATGCRRLVERLLEGMQAE